MAPAAHIPLPDLECPSFAALMLAGGAASPELAALGSPHRALIPLLGRPVAAYGLTALQRNPGIDSIAMIGPPEVANLAATYHAHWLPGQGSMLANLRAGLEHFQDREWVLLCGCDTPLVTSDILSNLLQEFTAVEADLYYPIVPRDVLERRYPGGKRTWVHLTQGSFTGGNVFLVRPGAILSNQRLFDRLIAARKNPMQLAGLLGLSFLVKFVTKNLNLEELEARASTLLKARARAIVTPHPEVGLDLDKAEDHAQLTQILQSKQEKKTGFFAAIPQG